jgi:tRNA threonylcarbamoyladenosine biosynthesis protein TsaE
MDPTIVRAASGGSLRTLSAEHTRAIGRSLGAAATPGTVIALIGELGAGKTQLAKGVADGLDVPSVVNSPTYVLMNEHVGRLRLFHIDAYRLAAAEEAVAAGLLDDRQAAGVAVIEWADRLAGWLPPDRLQVTLTSVPDDPSARELRWDAHGSAHESLAAAALRAT